MLDTRTCAADGCSAACPSSHLMCIPHWRMVPAPLQRAVRDAFRRWRSAISRNKRRGCTQETFDTATQLRQVQQLAIAAVREKQIKRDLSKQENQDRLF